MEAVLCDTCGNVGLEKGDDGFHYCSACGTQSQNFMEEDLGDYQGIGQDPTGRRTFAYARQHNVERQEQEQQLRKLNAMLRGDGDGAAEDLVDDPAAARAREEALLRAISQKGGEEEQTLERMRNSLASQFEDVENVHIWSGSQRMYDAGELPDRLAKHICEFYVQGLQRIIQLQCQALVEKFGVSPVICGIVKPIWLRFMAFSGVLEKDWASEAILLADAQRRKEREYKLRKKGLTTAPQGKIEEKGGSSKTKHYNVTTAARTRKRRKKAENTGKVPSTETGMKMSRVWIESLKDRLPLRATLAVVYLACYVAREPVLATDLAGWAGQGTLPYMTVFLEFQPKRFVGPDLKVIAVSELDPRNVFRPSFLSNAGMIELLAGFIANRLGMELPPVNFQAISLRLLEKLGIERDEVMCYLERLYEWYTPDGLWLSARRRSLPTSAFVTAMVIVTLKVLYEVDGHAVSGLYWPALTQLLEGRRRGRSKFQVVLDAIEKKLMDDALKPEPQLKDYLQYCQENVFAGARTTDEESLYDRLWKCFENPAQEVVRDHISEDNVDDHKQQEMEAPSTAQRGNLKSEGQNDDELTLGSGAWSRAPSIQKGKSRSSDEQQLDSDRNREELEQQEQLGNASTPLEPDEVTSENQRIQQAKNKLLNSIAHELKVCNFKIVPGRLAADEPEPSASYPMFPLLDHSRKSSKYVYADYFVLLYACSRFTMIKCNVIHKCVQLIEADLWQVERRVENFVESMTTSDH